MFLVHWCDCECVGVKEDMLEQALLGEYPQFGRKHHVPIMVGQNSLRCGGKFLEAREFKKVINRMYKNTLLSGKEKDLYSLGEIQQITN